MGDWVYGYDTLNRLTGAVNALSTTVGLQYANQIGCWAYDAFGNRTAQYYQTAPCPTPESNVPVPGTNQITYNSSNQVTGVNQSGPPNHLSGSFTYDAAGNVLNDITNQYAYDAEGRLCAVENNTTKIPTQYLYDASGTRVAKGTPSAMPASGATCPAPTSTNFTASALYLLGPSGAAVTELNGSGVWQHSNVSAGGVLANYSIADPSVYFQLTDPLGTRRILADATGKVQQTCLSLPYGDGESCPPTPTEQLFTGKERDTESGNDYFGARYYSSAVGRFMSPDWSAKVMPVPYAKLNDPQSLNLYAYVMNNPLTNVDPDGHDPPKSNCGFICQKIMAALKKAQQAVAQAESTTQGDFNSAATATKQVLKSTSKAVRSVANNPRVQLAADGAKNMFIGAAKGVQAILEAPTSESGVGAALTVYSLIGAGANTGTGVVEMQVALAGGSDESMNQAKDVADHVNALSSVGGEIGYWGSGGNWEAADKGAAAEGLGTALLGNGDANIKVNAAEKLADGIDHVDNAITLW
jgi:RHS repeat-associated protein